MCSPRHTASLSQAQKRNCTVYFQFCHLVLLREAWALGMWHAADFLFRAHGCPTSLAWEVCDQAPRSGVFSCPATWVMQSQDLELQGRVCLKPQKTISLARALQCLQGEGGGGSRASGGRFRKTCLGRSCPPPCTLDLGMRGGSCD